VRGELAKVQAKAEAADSTHQEQRKQMAAEAHRQAERLTATQPSETRRERRPARPARTPRPCAGGSKPWKPSWPRRRARPAARKRPDISVGFQ
jgi:hypothetical protein